jgi:hypothetical protein
MYCVEGRDGVEKWPSCNFRCDFLEELRVVGSLSFGFLDAVDRGCPNLRDVVLLPWKKFTDEGSFTRKTGHVEDSTGGAVEDHVTEHGNEDWD